MQRASVNDIFYALNSGNLEYFKSKFRELSASELSQASICGSQNYGEAVFNQVISAIVETQRKITAGTNPETETEELKKVLEGQYGILDYVKNNNFSSRIAINQRCIVTHKTPLQIAIEKNADERLIGKLFEIGAKLDVDVQHNNLECNILQYAFALTNVEGRELEGFDPVETCKKLIAQAALPPHITDQTRRIEGVYIDYLSRLCDAHELATRVLLRVDSNLNNVVSTLFDCRVDVKEAGLGWLTGFLGAEFSSQEGALGTAITLLGQNEHLDAEAKERIEAKLTKKAQDIENERNLLPLRRAVLEFASPHMSAIEIAIANLEASVVVDDQPVISDADKETFESISRLQLIDIQDAIANPKDPSARRLFSIFAEKSKLDLLLETYPTEVRDALLINCQDQSFHTAEGNLQAEKRPISSVSLISGLLKSKNGIEFIKHFINNNFVVAESILEAFIGLPIEHRKKFVSDENHDALSSLIRGIELSVLGKNITNSTFIHALLDCTDAANTPLLKEVIRDLIKNSIEDKGTLQDVLVSKGYDAQTSLIARIAEYDLLEEAEAQLIKESFPDLLTEVDANGLHLFQYAKGNIAAQFYLSADENLDELGEDLKNSYKLQFQAARYSNLKDEDRSDVDKRIRDGDIYNEIDTPDGSSKSLLEIAAEGNQKELVQQIINKHVELEKKLLQEQQTAQEAVQEVELQGESGAQINSKERTFKKQATSVIARVLPKKTREEWHKNITDILDSPSEMRLLIDRDSTGEDESWIASLMSGGELDPVVSAKKSGDTEVADFLVNSDPAYASKFGSIQIDSDYSINEKRVFDFSSPLKEALHEKESAMLDLFRGKGELLSYADAIADDYENIKQFTDSLGGIKDGTDEIYRLKSSDGHSLGTYVASFGGIKHWKEYEKKHSSAKKLSSRSPSAVDAVLADIGSPIQAALIAKHAAHSTDAKQRREVVIDYMIRENSPSLSGKNRDGQNLLHTIALCGDTDTLKILLSHHTYKFSDFSYALSQPDNNGKTPIDIMIEMGDTKILQKICESVVLHPSNSEPNYSFLLSRKVLEKAVMSNNSALFSAVLKLQQFLNDVSNPGRRVTFHSERGSDGRPLLSTLIAFNRVHLFRELCSHGLAPTKEEIHEILKPYQRSADGQVLDQDLNQISREMLDELIRSSGFNAAKASEIREINGAIVNRSVSTKKLKSDIKLRYSGRQIDAFLASLYDAEISDADPIQPIFGDLDTEEAQSTLIQELGDFDTDQLRKASASGTGSTKTVLQKLKVEEGLKEYVVQRTTIGAGSVIGRQIAKSNDKLCSSVAKGDYPAACELLIGQANVNILNNKVRRNLVKMVIESKNIDLINAFIRNHNTHICYEGGKNLMMLLLEGDCAKVNIDTCLSIGYSLADKTRSGTTAFDLMQHNRDAYQSISDKHSNDRDNLDSALHSVLNSIESNEKSHSTRRLISLASQFIDYRVPIVSSIMEQTYKKGVSQENPVIVKKRMKLLTTLVEELHFGNERNPKNGDNILHMLCESIKYNSSSIAEYSKPIKAILKHSTKSSKEMLLEKNSDGHNPLDILTETPHLPSILDLMVTEKNELLQCIDFTRLTMLAMLHGNNSVAEHIIENYSERINITSEDRGCSLLETAVRRGEIKLVELMLAHGGDINATDANGRNLLSILLDQAIDNGAALPYHEMMHLLVRKGISLEDNGEPNIQCKLEILSHRYNLISARARDLGVKEVLKKDYSEGLELFSKKPTAPVLQQNEAAAAITEEEKNEERKLLSQLKVPPDLFSVISSAQKKRVDDIKKIKEDVRSAIYSSIVSRNSSSSVLCSFLETIIPAGLLEISNKKVDVSCVGGLLNVTIHDKSVVNVDALFDIKNKVGRISRLTFKEGATVEIRKNVRGDSFYFVEKGSINVTTTAKFDGKKVKVNLVLKTNGEVALDKSNDGKFLKNPDGLDFSCSKAFVGTVHISSAIRKGRGSTASSFSKIKRDLQAGGVIPSADTPGPRTPPQSPIIPGRGTTNPANQM